MTLRDEIAKALAASNSWMLAHECRDSADALMPIVERAVERAVIDGANDQKIRQWSGQQTVGPDGVATIVARVMEGGQ